MKKELMLLALRFALTTGPIAVMYLVSWLRTVTVTTVISQVVGFALFAAPTAVVYPQQGN